MNHSQFLINGEEVVWKGKPSLHRFFCKADALIIPMFLLMLFADAAFLCVLIPIDNKSLGVRVFLMAALLLLCYILYGLVFRFIFKMYQKKASRYYITNKRVIVIQRDQIYDFPVFKAAKLAQVTECNKKGIGTIYLSRKKTFSDLADNTGMDFGLYRWRMSGLLRPLLPPKALAFYDIKDCKRVLKLLRHVKDLDENENMSSAHDRPCC